MNTETPTPTPGPTLTAADIKGGHAQRNDVVVLAERHGVPVRYCLHVDSHLPQSYFLIEAYDPDRRQWNELWAIPQATYILGGQDRQTTDPALRHIASPYDDDPDRKAASWQKIINKLTGYADRILAPRAPAGCCAHCADTSGATARTDGTAGDTDHPATN